MSSSPRTIRRIALTSVLSVAVLGCGKKDAPAKPAEKKSGDTPVAAGTDAGPTVEEAQAFAKEVDGKLRELWTAQARADWAKMTNITDETTKVAADAQAKVMAYETEVIKAARKFAKVEAGDDVRRQLKALRVMSTVPAPDDDAKREELSKIVARMDGIYGKGKFCKGEGDKDCRDLGALSGVLAESRDHDKQLEAWEGWRTISVPEMRKLYTRFVELANEGAKDIGFGDVGELWRSRYDMTPVAFEQELERLWLQVKPLYEQLHCHVRAKLNETYGDDKVAKAGMIPAHLTGNMWSQDWSNIYELLEPYPGESSLDVTKALKDKGYDALKMVKLGEGFFTSLGLNPLPASFYERSMFTKPKDRDVVCHASAWDVDYNNDLRIKMCIEVDHENLTTIHHELGHNYYYNNYYKLPVLFQGSAHDGFHEAVGDAIALSVNANYLKQVGLFDSVSTSEKAVINEQMQVALGKIAFLPFGKLIDQWRWDVFSGKVGPDAYNKHWWQLRAQYQGIAPPSGTSRGEEHFDPGAKYHIPGNTPYARYFMAHILQFQFHKAMCEAAGHKGPIHECSVYGSKEAGQKLAAMLAMGSSRPWPEALAKLTGTKSMEADALLEYFAPLAKYLEEQNAGRSCGWDG